MTSLISIIHHSSSEQLFFYARRSGNSTYRNAHYLNTSSLTRVKAKKGTYSTLYNVMIPARKRMRVEGGGSDFAEPLEPSATINDLPSEVMKNIFSFVGKGTYCLIGPVSKDFCFDYLTMDVIEDKFTHKMDYLQAIGRNRITTAEAASSSFDLAEYCFFKAPEHFQKQVVNRAIKKGRKDIVELGHAMGVDMKKLINLGSKKEQILFKIARRGDLEMLKFLQDKGVVNMKSNKTIISHGAADSNQLEILKWLHENNWLSSSNCEDFIFPVAARNGHISILEWSKDVAGFHLPSSLFNHAALGGNLDMIKYLRSIDLSSDEFTFNISVKSGNITLLQYLLENDCPHDKNLTLCTNAIEINDHEKALEALQWLHNQGFAWDEFTCSTIAEQGNLKALKYARLNGCPWNEDCLKNAVKYFHLEVVQYCLQSNCPIGNSDICCLAIRDKDHDRALRMLKLLREHSVPWSKIVSNEAMFFGNLQALKWAISNGCPWDREWCTSFVVRNGNIELLMLIRSHGVIFDESTFETVALRGNIETLKWLRSQNCPMGRKTITNAILSGNISVVEYCIENEFPSDDTLYEFAIKRFDDSFLVIKLLQEKGYPWHPRACKAAAYEHRGDLKLLRWLRYKGCPWDEETCNAAVRNDNLEILKYAHENGCLLTRETYRYCFLYDLDEVVDWIPTDEDARSEEILNYLKDHDCPKPDSHDWILRDWE